MDDTNLDENFDPDIEVFISYFEQLGLIDDYDVFEDYTSETYGNIDVSVNLCLNNSQPQSNPQHEPSAQQEDQNQPQQQGTNSNNIVEPNHIPA
jgi:hypothetical protein